VRVLQTSARRGGTSELVSANAHTVLQSQRKRPDEQVVGERQDSVRFRHERAVLGRLFRQVPQRSAGIFDGKSFARARNEH